MSFKITKRIMDIFKGKKLPIGHISHRKDGLYEKISNTGPVNKRWRKKVAAPKNTMYRYGYRHGNPIGQNGTFYTIEPMNIKGERRVKIYFNKPLELSYNQIEAFEGLPAEYLIGLWFGDLPIDYEAISESLDTISGEVMDYFVARKAIELGYDVINYGDKEVVDLKTFKQRPKYEKYYKKYGKFAKKSIRTPKDKYYESLRVMRPEIFTKSFKDWFGDWENDNKNASKIVNSDGTPKETYSIPMKMYHGTKHGGFRKFDNNYIGANTGNAEVGFYFTDSRAYAALYAETEGNILKNTPQDLFEYPDDYGYEIIKMFTREDDFGDAYENGNMYQTLKELVEEEGTQKGAKEFYLLYSPKSINTGIADEYGSKEDILEYLTKYINDVDAPGVYEVYLSMKNPLIVDYAGRAWNGNDGDGGHDSYFNLPRLEQEAFEKGYDGLIALDVLDNGPSNQYVVFNANQIKSVDNEGTFDPESNDIYKSFPIGTIRMWKNGKHRKTAQGWKRVVENKPAKKKAPKKTQSNQIKSAIGNNGNFDINSDDITKGLSSQIKQILANKGK